MGIMFPPPSMSEDEWVSGQDYQTMVNFVLRRGQSRKFTLAMVAHFRLGWHLLDEQSRSAVEVVERHADNFDQKGHNPHHAALGEATLLLFQSALTVVGYDPPGPPQLRDMYEVFGNPFRPVTVDPSWLTSDVLALGRGIYEERAFDRMPILADALQDAGCDSDDILNHLRDPNAVDVRGCWALDLVLGKV